MTAASTTAVLVGTWSVDASHTTASFVARKLRVIPVRGTIAVREGAVDIDAAGQPTAARAVLDPTTIATGIRRRDADLCGPRFLHVAVHSELTWAAWAFRPTSDGWQVDGGLRVAGGRNAPLTLEVTATLESDPGDVRFRARGTLDLATTPIRVPELLVGRLVELSIDARLVRSSRGRCPQERRR